ncbi:TadE family type IV pilus minor pilin [Rhodococcus sp. X156]|uniref:TadE family type IV pilus minor pilin n=1 Tax=Rhodococcus sp. X156 TaxID=2499145 RepID=UPI000FDA564E|nr:TadE family type IV pilus minor pilin [Rhodococcus sp. X156]
MRAVGRAAVRDDRGGVTVEAAIALSSLTVVLVAGMGAVLAVAMHVQCLDAAREAARLTARGEGERAVSVAEQVAPRGAAVSVRTEGDTVVVRVEATSALLPAVDISGEAVAVLEPSAGEPSAAPVGP